MQVISSLLIVPHPCLVLSPSRLKYFTSLTLPDLRNTVLHRLPAAYARFWGPGRAVVFKRVWVSELKPPKYRQIKIVPPF